MANIFTSGVTTESAFVSSSNTTYFAPEAVKVASGTSADGGAVTQDSGVYESAIYSIISDSNTYTYDGGTV